MKANPEKENSKKERSKSKAIDKVKKVPESEDDLFFSHMCDPKETGNKSNKCRSLIEATVTVTASIKQ